jgi:predicted lipoprotein with Yx(FWY)xxD motif
MTVRTLDAGTKDNRQEDNAMQRTRWMRAITGVSAALAIGAVAACGQAAVQGSASTPENDAVAPAAAQLESAVTDELAVATAGDLGQIVVDGGGRTLYRFDADTAKPPKSNCEGDCAAAWPPALASADGAVETEGIDKALIGTVDRADGTKQVTIAGWPAYHYAQDAAPGDIKGQGVGGKWFAFTPAGKKAGAKAAGAAPVVKMAVMKVGDLGPIVVDAEGMTLYRFDKDQKAVKSNCDGECATKWPPVIAPEGAQLQADGIDQSALSTITRSDGSKQVTVGGWPMYRFAGDKVPCDTNGQGVGGTWFATTATGAKAGL